ncbi:DNA-binding response OmpR family regulator [Anaerospora hongkongensis]|uniref:DNA-binding response OmpR family regulator n=1 Tax=Anaerospora hongkongensis TaxID=244830 RepID=A0A4R1PZH5_9FIRM|nr:response regulator transcription factor [Anaerospora hongkongensis]TCL38545.1 DNA-binding response OmpR family regulator [Anaerospora hongkongensis]
MRILVVEDDDMLREAVVAVLQEEFYLVEEAAAGSEGLYKALQGIYDLVVLDIMLPEMSGLVIVKKIRAKGIGIPVLLLTARDSIEDRVTGLEAGADDYLIKPFAVPELLARVKALLRRGGNIGNEGELSYGEITINARVKDAFINEVPLHLTVKEYELLEFLLINREQILTREQIYDRIWGLESDTTINIVDLYIHYLRKKLAPYGRDALIQTIRGAGFILKEK